MRPARDLFRDTGVKLLALILAWGLWYVVRADMDEARALTLPVELRPVPGCGIEGEAQRSHVTVQLRGPRHDVELLMSGTRPLVVPIRATDLAADQMSGQREIGAEDFDLPEPISPGSVRIEEVRGEPLRVRLWRVESRSVPVRSPEFPGADDAGIQVERKSWPPKVLVRGPIDSLNALVWIDAHVDRETLRRAVLQMGDEPRMQVSLPLTLPDLEGGGFTLIEPRTVEVQAELVRSGGARLPVPIVLVEDAGTTARTLRLVAAERAYLAGDPPRVILDLRGTPRAVASASAASVRAYVHVGELPADADHGELRIHVSGLPPGVALANENLTVPVEVVR